MIDLSNIKPRQKIPLVSVIIPCYNVEKYIDQCLTSIIDNGYDNLEIICIDDRSTDSTVEHIKNFQKKYNNIQLYHNEFDHNIYGGACRNMGLRYATGKYVYFCDSDDYTLPGLFAECVQKCEELGLDICSFGHDIFNCQNGMMCDDNSWIFRENYLVDKSICVFNKDVSTNIFKILPNECWSKLYRLEFLQRIGARFQNIRNSDDHLFHIKTLMCANSIYHIKKSFYFHRRNTENSVELAAIRGENLQDVVSSMKECYRIVSQEHSEELLKCFWDWQYTIFQYRKSISDITSIIDDIVSFAKEVNWYTNKLRDFCDGVKKNSSKQISYNTIWDRFDKIICIHYLPYKERLTQITNELNRVGILNLPQFEWFFTVPNSYYDDILISSRVDRNNVNFTNINYTINTLNLLNYCKINGWKKILLIEDDFKFVDDSKLINDVVSNIPGDYDVINFNYMMYGEKQSKQRLIEKLQDEYNHGRFFFDIRKFDNPPKIFYTSCIAFSNKMVDFILEQNEHCLKPFDHYFINDNHDQSLKCYLSSKELGYQDEFNERMKI